MDLLPPTQNPIEMTRCVCAHAHACLFMHKIQNCTGEKKKWGCEVWRILGQFVFGNVWKQIGPAWGARAKNIGQATPCLLLLQLVPFSLQALGQCPAGHHSDHSMLWARCHLGKWNDCGAAEPGNLQLEGWDHFTLTLFPQLKHLI